MLLSVTHCIAIRAPGRPCRLLLRLDPLRLASEAVAGTGKEREEACFLPIPNSSFPCRGALATVHCWQGNLPGPARAAGWVVHAPARARHCLGRKRDLDSSGWGLSSTWTRQSTKRLIGLAFSRRYPSAVQQPAEILARIRALPRGRGHGKTAASPPPFSGAPRRGRNYCTGTPPAASSPRRALKLEGSRPGAWRSLSG